MTKQKSLKSKVRTRMAKTGERYTAARRNLVSSPPHSPSSSTGRGPEGGVPVEMPVPDESVVRATGHGYDHWFALLDTWDGTSHTHTEIARWLSSEHGVPGWWTQAITVGYERARGRRVVGQQASGDWSIGATKTVNVPVDVLFAAFEQPAARERWLPGVAMQPRNKATLKGARYDWQDGSRVGVWFEHLGDNKSRVSVQHEKLSGADAAEAMKAWWRERVSELKVLLERGEM